MSSSEIKKRKRTYTEEDLKNALSDIRDNKKSVRQISKEYGIPKTTILDKISGRRPDGVKKPGPEPALGVDGEKKVVQWLLDIAKCGFPVKKQELLDTVQKIIRDGKIKNKFTNDRPGQKWFENFMARNKEISLKNAEGINKARAQVTEESIRLWFRELEEYLDSIHQKDILSDPKRIFNGDESGFALCPKTGKVLGPRGYKNLCQIKPSNEKENITVLLTFNANGDMCPPCIVFPYIRPPKAVVSSMPQEWCLGRSETGWMRGEVFFEYITNEFHNWVEQNEIKKPVLLLVDGHKSHMSLMLSTICEQMQIILYALPPNTTHILQPADVSVFAPVKTYWKSTVREFLSKPENLNSAVTKTNFCILLNDALKRPNMPDNIKNGFKRCGLYPFDANSPDYTKCVRNTLENVQSADKQTQNISHTDIKILKHLKPTLNEKNINIRTITKAVNNLKKSLPSEVGFAEISIETESENSQTEQSIEQNTSSALFSPIDCELNATKEITISSLHEDKNRNSENNNTDPTLKIQTVSAEIHTAPKQSAEPCTSMISTKNRNLASRSCTDYDKITVYQEDSVTPVTNKNVLSTDMSVSTLHLSGSYLDISLISSLDDLPITSLEDKATPASSSIEREIPFSREQSSELPLTDFNKDVLSTDMSISTLHLSGSFLDLGSIVSLDDLLIVPLDNTATPTMLSSNKETPSTNEEELPLTTTNHIVSAVVSPSLSTKKSPETQPASEAVGDLTQKNTNDPFKSHLMLPEISNKVRKTNKRTPAAISSAAWRQYYENKEKTKNEKQAAIRKRKLERIEKQEKKKKLKEIQNVHKTPKRKKKTHPVRGTPDRLEEEAQKENLPAANATKCAECDDILISDVEDDDEKNIGCDKCARWYHLKCTQFLGTTYFEVKDKPFQCNLCD